MEETTIPAHEFYIQNLEGSARLNSKAIKAAIASLGLFEGATLLDVPCGLGTHARWMVEHCPSLSVTGLDLESAHLDYAHQQVGNAGLGKSISLVRGDINAMEFEDDSFDFIWCCDGLWPGPKEMGCLAEKPYEILKDMARIIKPGGTIAVLFWSSQKILPGHPFVEAALNNTSGANIPLLPDSDPTLHFMRAPLWLQKTGLTDIKVETFSADIQGPLSSDNQRDMVMLANMFWGRAQDEVEPAVWGLYQRLVSPESEEYIFGRDDYAGLLTYTMFTGKKMIK